MAQLVTANQFQLQANPVQALSGGLQVGEQFRQVQLQPQIQQLQQQAALGNQDALNQLAGLAPQQARQLQQFQLGQAQAAQAVDEATKRDFVNFSLRLKNTPPEQRLRILEQRRADLVMRGRDTSDTDFAIQATQEGRHGELDSILTGIEQAGIQQGLIKPLDGARSASLNEFNTLVDIAKNDPAGETIQGKAALVELGLQARASKSAAERIAQDPLLSQQVAASEALKAGEKEGAKLARQFKLKPQIQAAVTSATAQAKAMGDEAIKAKSNSKALELYDTAMSGLTDALGGTVTGPIAGWLPAVTTDAQIAEGAVAAMAPVLKQLFRGAGEGTFTDKDQELLLQMIPTRRTSPEAIKSVMQNIDAIVRAKLGQSTQPQAQTAQQPQVLNFDAQGNLIQ